MKLIVILALICCLVPIMCFGLQIDNEISKLMKMSLEKLMEVEVVTASKKAQDISYAPADITVVTSKMIKERGYRDLKDVFRDSPGFDISENVEGEVRTLIISRGILGNNKIMVLRDGKKLNTSTGERFLYGNNIPLFNVKRIEIIVGPSSAMYGADAYAGVVNLISKEGDDIDGLEMDLCFGSNGLLEESILYGKKIDERTSFTLSLRKYDSNGEDPSNYKEYKDLGLKSGDIDMPIDNYNFYGRARLKDFTFSLYRMDASEPNGYSTNPAWFDLDEEFLWRQVVEKVSADHKYGRGKIGISSSFEFFAYEVKNESNFHYSDSSLGKQYKYAKSTTFKWEEKVNVSLREYLDFSMGWAYENINSFPKTSNLNKKFDTDALVDDMSAWYVDGKVFGLEEMKGPPAMGVRNFEKFGVYGEVTAKISGHVQLNAGVRYDDASNYDPDDFYNTVSPRLGAIWNPEKTTVKLLYGEAYIQPSEYDKWENFVGGKNLAHIPNPNLESENLRSFLGIISRKINNKTRVCLSLFHNQLENIIRPTPYRDDNPFVKEVMAEGAFIETNANQGKQKTYGLELKINHAFKNLCGYLYYSYLKAEENDGVLISKISPNKIQGGLTCYFLDKYSVSSRFRWYDKASGLGKDMKVHESLIDSRWVVDLSIRGPEIYKKTSVYANITNLLDKEYYSSSPFGEGPSGWIMEKTPQPGMNFQVGFTFKFN